MRKNKPEKEIISANKLKQPEEEKNTIVEKLVQKIKNTEKLEADDEINKPKEVIEIQKPIAKKPIASNLSDFLY